VRGMRLSVRPSLPWACRQGARAQSSNAPTFNPHTPHPDAFLAGEYSTTRPTVCIGSEANVVQLEAARLPAIFVVSMPFDERTRNLYRRHSTQACVSFRFAGGAQF
jgi:hypothetical protein